MPVAEGPLKRGFLGLLSSQTSSSGASNRYDNVNVGGSSSAVIGNVVHQHFYDSKDGPPAGDNVQERTLQLRSGFTQPQIDAISNYDHRYAHWLRTQPRVEGTCQWIMRLPEFRQWAKEETLPILLCVGSVGCGKTITAGAVIDWLNMATSPPGPIVLSYYVDPARPQPPTASEILRAFVKQITLYYKEGGFLMPPDLRTVIEATLVAIKSMIATILALTAILQHFLRLHPSCYIVVDGIDALSESEILVFVNFLREVWSTSPGCSSFGRLMLFCRETLGRRIRLDSVPASVLLQIKLDHVRSDIHTYVEYQVAFQQQQCPITSDVALVDEIKTALRSNSEKMFLWVHLQILSLWDPGVITCDQDIRDQLNCLPEGLDEIYIRCLQRINTTNDKRSQEIAPRIFKWLASAQIALSPLQAREAVSMTPDNLPLNLSEVLSFPVTDYCANLLVLDDLTGTVKFAHPSVKDFLFDADKVPPGLKHLSLSDDKDTFWCGAICVAHAKLHKSRQQVVVFRKQEINQRIASPIIRNIFETVSPFKLPSRSPNAPKESYRMPLSAVPTQKASLVEDASLHDYICKHWLTHNATIQEHHPHYNDFKDLCLSHDPHLQPWSTTQVTNIEHYRLMVMHAVMINHAPLLRLAQTTIKSKGSEYHQGVFGRFAPGTDSTYLHCAAALGHVDVLRILLDDPGNFGDVANALGTSAALVAMQSQQMEAFELLVTNRRSEVLLPYWFSSTPKMERYRSKQERLLDICTIEGNLQAVRVLLSVSNVESLDNRDVLTALTETFSIACKYGRQEIGELLIRYGAEMDSSYWTVENGSLRFRRYGQDHGRPALQAFLESRDLLMMKTLLAIRRSVEVETDLAVLIQTVDAIGGSRKDWYPYIALVLDFSTNTTKRRRNRGTLWWLEDLIISVDSGHLTYREADRVLRLVLQYSHTDPKELSVHRRHSALSNPIRPDLISEWLNDAADDVLILLVKSGWITCRSLISIIHTENVFKRGSSRALECVLDFASRCRECNLGAVLWYHVGVAGPKFLVSGGARHLPLQMLEFLLYSNFEWAGKWLSSREQISESIVHSLVRSIRAYENDHQHPKYPCLMWIRCYARMKGDVVATRALCNELQRVGSDGNFALNFPAGYGSRSQSVLEGHQWGISQNVWRALHGWNFRLNRARGKPFSESDMWYAAYLLKVLHVSKMRKRL